jgi:hypothetical protein
VHLYLYESFCDGDVGVNVCDSLCFGSFCDGEPCTITCDESFCDGDVGVNVCGSLCCDNDLNT